LDKEETMKKYGITYSNAITSVCQTGYVFDTPEKAAAEGQRVLNGGESSVPVDYFPLSLDDPRFIHFARVEADDYGDVDWPELKREMGS
jgi:hypothetical protein